MPQAAASAALCPPSSVSTFHPTPELDLTITQFTLNRSGTHAIAGGPTLADPELSAVFVLAVAARKPHPGSKLTADVPSIVLDEGFYTSHPGLRVLQISWHPHSDQHVVVLTSDATLRLYDITRPELAEQTFELLPGDGRRGLGLNLDSSLSSPPIAFTFGVGSGWDRFAIYFLYKNASISVICPIAPFGARYPSHTITSLQIALDGGGGDAAATAYEDDAKGGAAATALLNEEDAATAEAWIQRAFQPLDTITTTIATVSSFLSTTSTTNASSMGGETVPEVHVCLPHALDDHSPAVGGPLPVHTCDGGGSSSGSGNPTSMLGAVLSPAEDLLMWRYGGECTAVAVVSAKGPVGVSILTGSGAVPAWHPSPPQCVVQGVELKAVRCQCAVAAMSPSSLSMNNSGGGGALPSSPQHEHQQELLLIDLIRLQPLFAADQVKSEEEGEEDDDDDDGVASYQARTPGSTRARLQLDLASTDTIYCVYPGQCYVVHLPWLPVIAQYLLANSGNSRHSSGSSSGKNVLPDALPCARAEELYSPSSTATEAAAAPSSSRTTTIAGVAVGDALCSSALVVLQSDSTARCVRPSHTSRGSTVSVSNEQQMRDGGSTSAATAQQMKSDADINTHIQRIYGDILKGAQSAVVPRVGAAEMGSAEGTRALADAVAVLRSSHVEFAHRAHHDLEERLEQLRCEVEAQEDRAERVATLTQRADEQRGRLDAGIKKSVWMADNISRRLHLLAELHWALPRPASAAEVAYKREELPYLEETVQKLTSEISLLRGRVGAMHRDVLERKKSSGGAVVLLGGKSTSGAPQLPPAQLRQVREMLGEHDQVIRAAKQQAAVLEGVLAGA